MSFQTDGENQILLIASTWAAYQAAVAAPINVQDTENKRAAHCAALNGGAYRWDQHFSSDMQAETGGTDKPKTLA